MTTTFNVTNTITCTTIAEFNELVTHLTNHGYVAPSTPPIGFDTVAVDSVNMSATLTTEKQIDVTELG